MEDKRRLQGDDLADFLVMQQQNLTRHYAAAAPGARAEFLIGMAAGLGMADAIAEGGVTPAELDALREWRSARTPDEEELAGVYRRALAEHAAYMR